MKSEHPLRQIAGGLILVALIYAPLALGSIPPPLLLGLEGLLALATLFWAMDALLHRTLPRVPPLLGVCCGWLLLQGWGMAWNARSVFTPPGFILTLTSPLPNAPGAIERAIAVHAMLSLTSVLAALIVVTDLAQDPVWRTRLLWAMAWTGACFSVFGLAQKAELVHFVSAQMNRYEGDYFSTYNYHANAGAFLNLVLPAIGSLLFVAQAEKHALARRLLLGGLFVCCLVAALVNTSRGAQAITVVLLIGLGIWVGLRLARAEGRRARKVRMALAGGCFACLVGGGLLVPHLGRVVQKWEQLPQVLTGDSGRMQVWPIAASMARQSGPLGQGPGAFKLLLPRSPLLTNAFYSRWIIQMPIPGGPTSMWSQAHEDYLQTLIEFGWLGSLAAGTILFGGIACLWRAVLRDRVRPSSLVYVGILAALLAVALHATFDFPLQLVSLQLYVAAYLGIAWATSSPKQATELHNGEVASHNAAHEA
ncbi:MAG: O-antigen polymerase [Chthonomonadales bacterium]|nr:O-antigen polymerase [Chthonomonadales bacterium]